MTRLTIAFVLIVFTGCGTLTKRAQTNLSETDTQARRNAERVDLAAIQAGQIDKLLSSATQNIDKGLRIQDSGKDLARLPDGTPVMLTVQTAAGPVTTPIYSEWTYEASLSSYVDLTSGGIEGLELDVGKVVEAVGGNLGLSTVPKRDGLSLSIVKAGGSTTNSDAIRALKGGQADNKAAAGVAVAEAVQIDLAGKLEIVDGVARLIDSTGKAIEGVLVAINPVAAGANLAEVILKTESGEVVKRIIPKE